MASKKKASPTSMIPKCPACGPDMMNMSGMGDMSKGSGTMPRVTSPKKASKAAKGQYSGMTPDTDMDGY